MPIDTVPSLAGRPMPHFRMSVASPPDTSAALPPTTAYVRERDLPRLIAIWPNELEVSGLSSHGRLVAKIRRALRAERERGKTGHWTYDLARHALLLSAYRCEVQHLARRMSGRADRAA